MELSPRDLDLAARIRAGDYIAFERSFRSFYELLLSYGYGIVSSESVASDLLVDVFATLWHSRSEWKPSGSLAAYFLGSIRHRAIEYLRRDKGWKHIWDKTPELENEPARTQPTGTFELTKSIADSLYGIRREVVFLRWRAKLNPTEIALMLGMSEGGINSHLENVLGEIKRTAPECECGKELNLAQLDQYLGGNLDTAISSSLDECVALQPGLKDAIEYISSIELERDLPPVYGNVDADLARTQLHIRGIEAIEKSKADAVLRAKSRSSLVAYFSRLRRRKSLSREPRSGFTSSFRRSSSFVYILLLVLSISALVFAWIWR